MPPIALAAAALLVTGGALGEPLRQVPIPAAWEEAWLEEVAPWIEPGEAVAYRALDGAGRQHFRRRFWAQRDPSPQIAINEAKEEYLNHLAAVRVAGIAMTDPAARLLLLHGYPALITQHGDCGHEPSNRRIESECIVAPPFRLFDYGEDAPLGTAPALFVQREDACSLFEPSDRKSFRAQHLAPSLCVGPSYDLPGRLREAVRQHPSWEQIEATGLQLVARPDAHRDSRGRPDVPLRLEIAARHETDRAGAFQIDGVLRLDWSPHRLQPLLPWRNLTLRLDIHSGDARVFALDRNEWLVVDGSPNTVIPLQLELVAGEYTVVVHVEDETDQLFETAAYALHVSGSPAAGGVTNARAAEPASLRRPDSGVSDLIHGPFVSIQAPTGLVMGERRVGLVVERGPVARVEYRLVEAGVTLAAGGNHDAIVDFGPVPEEQTLEALAYDAAGDLVARDRVRVNLGAHRFHLDLFGAAPLSSAELMVKGLVTVPIGQSLREVTLFEGDALVAELTDPHFHYSRATTPEERRGSAVVLRAVATLSSGEAIRRTLLLSSHLTEEVGVGLVEAFAGIVGRDGRPLVDIRPEEVRVSENGVSQELRSLRHLDELPINVVLLLDTSTTMARHIEAVREGALKFLRQVLREDDRAALLSFNHKTFVVVPFTSDLPVLEAGSETLRVWGATSLFDSVTRALYYLHGVEGKKALVLVSDGVEETSDLRLEQILGHADRVDAAVYTIGLGVPGHRLDAAKDARTALQEIARATGGAFFRVRSAGALDEVYRQIEADLRSQYLLTYESSLGGRSADAGYRSIDVEVTRRGAQVKARTGYHPR